MAHPEWQLINRELVGAQTNRQLTVHRWLFEAYGGHGRTLWHAWTRQHIEDTWPSSVDPVNVLDTVDTAHGSQ